MIMKTYYCPNCSKELKINWSPGMTSCQCDNCGTVFPISNDPAEGRDPISYRGGSNTPPRNINQSVSPNIPPNTYQSSPMNAPPNTPYNSAQNSPPNNTGLGAAPSGPPGFVPAICPNCRGELTVDPSMEAAVCKYCNTPYIVSNAIQKYNITNNTYNTTNNTYVNNAKKNAVESVLGFVSDQQQRKDQRRKDEEEAERVRQEAERQRIEAEQQKQRELAEAKKKKAKELFDKYKKPALILIGIILIFPLPLTLFLLPNQSLKKNLKKGIIAGAWALYAIILIVLFAGKHAGQKEKMIAVPESSSSFTGMYYSTVEAQLKDSGFKDIDMIKIEDLKKDSNETEGNVETVTIGGNSKFSKGDKFAESSKIKISYHAFATEPEANAVTSVAENKVTEVPNDSAVIPDSVLDFTGKDYTIIMNDLQDAGFTNIQTNAIEDLKIGFLKSEGEVENISINGSSSIEKGAVYPKDVKIRIDYHAFPQTTTVTTTAKAEVEADIGSESETTTVATTKKAEKTKKTTTEKATATKKETTTKKQTDPDDNLSTGQKNAVNQAKSYLSFTAFSYSGLISQLKFEGYTDAEAKYGADNCGADWNQQAQKKAKEYLNTTAFSRSGLIEQLQFEGFTQNEAVYGTDASGADWNQQAAKKAQDYLGMMSFSRDDLIGQLEFEGFTHEQAEYGVSAVGY